MVIAAKKPWSKELAHMQECQPVNKLPLKQTGKNLGIEIACQLIIKIFDLYDNFVIDVQQDFFEGYCGYVVKLVLKFWFASIKVQLSSN